ncbi:MAG: branched-chain amino acid transport system permease protein [Thermoleophilaceae bacterium]|jgi:branched-chain amino acid transport system permease protein|nr:branched-chain amino acid transport system permease protein [Thermoleophilaceae bacterium]
MNALAELRDTWSRLRKRRHFTLVAGIVVIALAAIIPPFAFGSLSNNLNVAVYAVIYVVFALGLNIVVGFAGLLDLGYVAFYAIGAYAVGWFGSDFFSYVNGSKGIRIGVPDGPTTAAGIHLNFFLIIAIAIALSAMAGVVIGLPTLRLRGDYIAIVTLAFGEIAGTIALNGDSVHLGKYYLTAGQQAISPVDQPYLGFVKQFNSATDLRPYYWLGLGMAVVTLLINFALRDSRLGRAWIAIREDEVAAASMGVPLVRTKLLSYAVGASLGGMAGTFLGVYKQAINSNQFQFYFSIVILAMVILGGLGSIWGVVFGAVALAVIDQKLIPDTFHDLPSKIPFLNFNFSSSEISFAIYGFLLVVIMLARPEGLFPERRRKMELTQGAGTDESMYEASA